MGAVRRVLALAGALALASAGIAMAAGAEGASADDRARRSGGSADARIEQQVQSRLEERSALRRVRVEAQEGTVTLQGSVERAAERLEAETLAADVSGVETVRNEIRVGSAGDVSSPPPGDE